MGEWQLLFFPQNVKDKVRAAPSKAAMAIVEEEMAKVKENLQQPSPRRTIWNVKQIVFVRQEDHNTEQTLTLRSIKTMSQRAFCDVTSISSTGTRGKSTWS